jgi:hypothetical protein
MQRDGSRVGLFGVVGAACVGFFGLDQVAASHERDDAGGKPPHVSDSIVHVRQSRDAATSTSAQQAVETPPLQRPAINGSLGEGSDALDAKEARRPEAAKREQPSKEQSEPARAPEDTPTLSALRNRSGVPTLAAPPIPRAERFEPPPLASEVMSRGWNDPETQAQRGQRSAENGGPAPLWLEAIASQFGIRARFIPLHRPSNTVSRYVDPCDKRDYRCQEFHDNFFREDVPTSPLGMTNSIGAGVAGGIVRATKVDREIKAPVMWTVKPRFVGIEAGF